MIDCGESQIEAESIAIAASDAGGANILHSLLGKFSGRIVARVEGPARSILKSLPNLRMADDLDELLRDAELLLTGSGYTSLFEWDAIRMARDMRIETTTFLDHWSNFRVRFERHGHLVLPDRIWVGDKYAFDQASMELPECRIELVCNPFESDIISHVAKLDREAVECNFPHNTARYEGDRILVVTEPAGSLARNIARHPGVRGYDEYEALEHIFACIAENFSDALRVTVRLHPSEASGKYDQVINQVSMRNVFVSSNSLQVDLFEADIVIGTNSAVLPLASACGRHAFSAIPPMGYPRLLPHAGVKSLHLDRISGKAPSSLLSARPSRIWEEECP